MTIIPIGIGVFGIFTKGLIKGLEDFANKRITRDHPNYYIIEKGQNTEMSPGDLRRLSVAQIPVKDHHLKRM